MRKIVIIVSILCIVISGCRQATKMHAETVSESNVENLCIRQYSGIYNFGGRNSEAPNGTVYIYPETDSTALFYLFKIRGAPSYNMGSVDGRITIEDGKATFREHFDDRENACVTI